MDTFINYITSDAVKFFIAILSVINPLGAIPQFVGMTADFGQKQTKKIAKIASFSTFMAMLVSLLAGSKILNFFGISIPSFTIGGGILIFSMGINMLNAQRPRTKLGKSEAKELEDSDDGLEIGIVPLAIPLLAGPGTISTIIIHAKDVHGVLAYIGPILVIGAISSFIIWPVLHNARWLADRMGRVGLNVITRVMGLIVVSISVEMIAHGLKSMLPILQNG